MLETDAHKAFRKKLESLTTKYEPQFPFAKAIASVNYWNQKGVWRNSSSLCRSVNYGQPNSFYPIGLEVANDVDNRGFNLCLTTAFASAYLTHLMNSNGTELNRVMNLRINFPVKPSEYFIPPRLNEVNIEAVVPDPEQSWIKYFEQLKDICDRVYNELTAEGGIVAVETNA